ncbi:MAG TPA: DUF4914 family protein, partial [Candidatus Hydrogenedentes bacterium]|nr:DUF4914 family protein [Candidatus Hydrogenedentota bacterium]
MAGKITRASYPWQKFNPPPEAEDILKNAPSVIPAFSKEELVDLAVGGADSSSFTVGYEVPGRGFIVEATVARVRNGICANYTDPYMRRRDPDCMVIGDN